MGIANNVVIAIVQSDVSKMKYIPAYFLGPTLGCMLAAAFCKFASEPIVVSRCGEQEEKEEERKSIKKIMKTMRTYNPNSNLNLSSHASNSILTGHITGQIE